jgi:hypothetical protein
MQEQAAAYVVMMLVIMGIFIALAAAGVIPWGK